jgi:hypothetical protein
MTQLFKCPGCGGPVSPAANTCPRCGQVIDSAALPDDRVEGPLVAPTAPMPRATPTPVPGPPVVSPPTAPGPRVDPAAVMTPAATPRKRRRLGLIIGLSVGIPVGVVALLVIVGAALSAFMLRAADDEMAAMVGVEQQMQISVDLGLLETSAEVYRMQNPGACPSHADLVGAGIVSPENSAVDPWGRPYVVDCSSGAPNAYSVGPDGLAGTLDDVNN